MTSSWIAQHLYWDARISTGIAGTTFGCLICTCVVFVDVIQFQWIHVIHYSEIFLGHGLLGKTHVKIVVNYQGFSNLAFVCCQPIRSQVWKYLLITMDFTLKCLSNPRPSVTSLVLPYQFHLSQASGYGSKVQIAWPVGTSLVNCCSGWCWYTFNTLRTGVKWTPLSTPLLTLKCFHLMTSTK